MKRIFSLFLLFVLACFSLAACKNNDMEIIYGEENNYSKDDMDSAIKVIMNKFNTWSGCIMHKISYESDRTSESLNYCNELDPNANFDECIVFSSNFHSPKDEKSAQALSPDEEYRNWDWYLARQNKGEWKLLTWGY